MVAIFESIRIEEYGNAVIAYNSELHAIRLFKSINILGFKNLSLDCNVEQSSPRNDILLFQNQIKNFLQYHFNKAVSFKEAVIAKPNKKAPTHKVYKLRFIYHENGKIEINIEEYTRKLDLDWKVRVIKPQEFHIKTQELQWRHKLYPQEGIPVSAEWQEQIWLNEKGEICEGSFTNIFWQDKAGSWYTPSLETNILAGTMRELVIKELEAEEVNYTVYDLKQAKQVVLTNAMIGIKSVILSETKNPMQNISYD